MYFLYFHGWMTLRKIQLQQHDVQNSSAKRPIPVSVWEAVTSFEGGGLKPPKPRPGYVPGDIVRYITAFKPEFQGYVSFRRRLSRKRHIVGP